MKVVASVLPGLGHLNPMVPLLKELAGRGHAGDVVVPPPFAPFVEAVGLPVTGLGPAWTEAGIEDLVPGWHDFDGLEQFAVWIEMSHGFVSHLHAHVEAAGADVMVHDHYELASWVVGEQLGIPTVPYAMTVRALEPAFVKLAGLQEKLDGLALAFGLPAEGGEGRVSRWLYLDALPPSLTAALLPPGPTVHTVAHVADDRTGGGELPAWLSERDATRRLVYVTLGTVFNERPEVLHALVAGASQADADVLVTVGHGGPDLGDLPSNVHVEEYVPQAALYESLAAVVCHGGFGTVFGALGHGVPVVCAPMSADQPFNASAVAGVGAGISLATQFGAGALFPALQAGEPRVGDVASAVGRALDDPELRAGAARVAAEMAAQRSPAEAADLVEQLVATGEPVTRA